MKTVSLYRGVVLLIFVTAASAAEPEQQQESYEPGIPLPAGPGRELVATACTRCHDLRGLPAYKGYWNRARWGAMVETMVRNGATLDAMQMNQVADYLTEHFGPNSRK